MSNGLQFYDSASSCMDCSVLVTSGSDSIF